MKYENIVVVSIVVSCQPEAVFLTLLTNQNLCSGLGIWDSLDLKSITQSTNMGLTLQKKTKKHCGDNGNEVNHKVSIT